MTNTRARGFLSALALSSTALAGPAIDPVIPQQLIARLQPGQSVTAFAADHNLAVVPGREIPSRNIYLFNILVPVQDPVIFAANIQGTDPRVQWAEANYFGDTPEGSARSFYFNRVDVPSWFREQPAFVQIGLNDAGLSQPSAGGQTVAVVDTGLDVSHPEVQGATAPGINLFDLNTNVAEIATGADADGDGVSDEMVGHGTHVATIVEFVAPESTILPIRAFNNEGNGDNYVLGQSIFWAIDHGATIINVSAGSTYHNQVIEDAIDEAAARGIPIVAAAGNLSVQTPEYPAMDPDAIGVAAVNDLDVRADFSNFNLEVDVSAPGVEVYGGLPGAEYAAWDGTSFGAPMVSGIAALIMARHPEWGPAEYRVHNVRTALRDSAFNIDQLNPGFQGMLGGGRLDAAAAVRLPSRFTTASNLSASGSPTSLATGDFNGDGKMDYAVANGATGNILLAFGDGAGGFQNGPILAGGNQVEKLLAANLNDDSAIDLAVAIESSTIRVFYNDGAGQFPSATSVNIGAEPSAMTAGDMNGDGRTDLIVATRDAGDAVRVVLNVSDGVFSTQPWMPVGRRPVGIAVGRLNADAALDVVTANRDADNVTVLMGVGNGSLNSGTSYASGASDPRAVVITDLDTDGANDIVIAANDGGSIVIRWNSGAGLFSGAPTIKPMNDHRGANSLSLADVSCDGRPDVVIGSGDAPEGYASVLLNRASRNPFGPLDWATGLQVEDVAAADFDGDGLPDLLSANELSNNVSLLRNLSCADAGDLNCDGLVTVSDIAGFVLALTDPASYAINYPICRSRNGDVNADGSVSVGDIGPFVSLLLAQ